jgi:hypothetical protein
MVIEQSSQEIVTQMFQISQASPFPWLVISMICISISFMLVAIIYMLGRVFESDRLKKWAHAEFLTALSTLIIIGLFVTFMLAVSNMVYKLSMEITKTTDPALYVQIQRDIDEGKLSLDTAHFLPAHNYIDGVRKCTSLMYVTNFCTALVVEPFAWYEGLNTDLLSVPLFAVRNTARSLNNTFTYLLYTTYLQKHILFFAQQVSLAVFLPLGILLRSMLFTRGAGNLFIALGLGLYFIYPVSYSVVLMVSNPPGTFESKCGVSGPADEIGLGWSCTKAIGKTAAFSAVSLFPVFSISMFGSLSPFLKLMTASTVMVPAAVTYYNQMQPLINEAIAYAMVYPLVVMAITLTFIKSFATFLGADAQNLVQGLFKIL